MIMQFEKFFLWLRPDRRQHVRAGRDHRSRQDSQTKEETIQEISLGLWTDATLCGGGNTMEVPPTRSRYGRVLDRRKNE